MFGPKIRLDKDLYERVKQCAEAAGYSSPEEFVGHVLEQAVAALEEGDTSEEVSKRLKGLGYLD